MKPCKLQLKSLKKRRGGLIVRYIFSTKKKYKKFDIAMENKTVFITHISLVPRKCF